MVKKLTYEFVKSKFEEEGYELLSTEYVNCYAKLEYICPKGHKHSTAWYKWVQDRRCPHCYGNAKVTIKQVRSSFEKEGYILLTKIYTGNKQKLEYVCSNGHQHFIRWNDWQTGYRCPYCSGKINITIDYICNLFEKEGYVLLSDKYVSSNAKLNYRCVNGHHHAISWDSWKQGHRCPYCVGVAKLTIEFVRDSFKKAGYTLVSKKYINTSTKLKYKCCHGHAHEMTYTNWNAGWRCPTCKSIRQSMCVGKLSPNWCGGLSKDGYCEVWKDKEYKQDIRDRDGNCCLNPYCSSNNTSDLTIHHIDYDKKNCHPSNLITVCRSCNSRANVNRQWHKAWYQAVMHRRYNYIY